MKHVKLFESFIDSQKVNEENITMMEPFYEYGWSDEYDNKYAPLMNALRASSLDDCVILGEYMPEFLEDEKVLKSFDMNGLEDGTDDIESDPHGDCSFQLYKHNGMLIGMFYAEGHFSGTVCHKRDAKKWEKYFKQNDAGDYLYELAQ